MNDDQIKAMFEARTRGNRLDRWVNKYFKFRKGW